METKKGYTFSNPIGLASDFDTKGKAIDGLLGNYKFSLKNKHIDLGFGFVEIGSATSE